MKLYIAGKMRGIPQYNFPAFDAARDLLRSAGHDPISPADLDREEGFDPNTDEVDADFIFHAMRRDLAAVLGSDGLVLLPGWQTSTGAKAEKFVAEQIGIPVYELHGEVLCLTMAKEGAHV